MPAITLPDGSKREYPQPVTVAEVAASILRVKELGATPILAQYSPIPGTVLWPRALATSRYDLTADPLFHNNSLFPC